MSGEEEGQQDGDAERQAREEKEIARTIKIRGALTKGARRLMDSEQEHLGLRVSKRCAEPLTELLLDYAARLGGDLRLFATHARRSTVGVDDVLMCARKNRDLSAELQEFAHEHELARSQQPSSGKHAKRKAPQGSGAAADGRPKKLKKKKADKRDKGANE